MSHATLHTEWTSGGVPHSVDTTHIENESNDAWHARHDEAVRFWQDQYPPDP